MIKTSVEILKKQMLSEFVSFISDNGILGVGCSEINRDHI